MTDIYHLNTVNAKFTLIILRCNIMQRRLLNNVLWLTFTEQTRVQLEVPSTPFRLIPIRSELIVGLWEAISNFKKLVLEKKKKCSKYEKLLKRRRAACGRP